MRPSEWPIDTKSSQNHSNSNVITQLAKKIYFDVCAPAKHINSDAICFAICLKGREKCNENICM